MNPIGRTTGESQSFYGGGHRYENGHNGGWEKTVPDRISAAEEELHSVRRCFDRKNQKNLYDATMDLMAIADTESKAALKAIHTRLMFKARMMKASGAESSEIKRAVSKINKVIGKVKTKIKKLQKEEALEKKKENARKAKQRAMEAELRRELEMRRKVRKNRERKDVEDSKMGMGANDGGAGSYDGGFSQIDNLDTGSYDMSPIPAADGGAAVASDACAEAAASVDVYL